MLAIIYLAVLIMLGDSICRRFFDFVSLPHRIAAAVVVGLLFGSWATYLYGLLFAAAAQPLLWGNLLFFATAIGLLVWLRRPAPTAPTINPAFSTALSADDKWDWALIGCFLVVAIWQMFGTFNMDGNNLQIGNHQWSDFGSNIAIMQTFALGHNFPTEYPHFSGDRIRYHFLFYFLAGNLQYLGLNPAWSNNLLSIFSLVSMLILVMTLGEVLFRSRAVGRIGAVLFFFHGTLSFVPFFLAHESFGDALTAMTTMKDFLPSGFTYRGETWGIWSQVVFLNQRHFTSSISIFLIVFVFLLMRYRAVPVTPKREKTVLPAREFVTETELSSDAAVSQNPDNVVSQESDRMVAREQATAQESNQFPDVAHESFEPRDGMQESEPKPHEEPEINRTQSSDAEQTHLTQSSEAEQIYQVHDDTQHNDQTYGEDNRREFDSALNDEHESDRADDDSPRFDRPHDEPETQSVDEQPKFFGAEWRRKHLASVNGFVFAGVLLGLLPMWNSAVFVAAFAVLAALFVLFPLRKQMLFLAVTTGLVALPQVIYLKTGDVRPSDVSLFFWGYIVENPTPANVAAYLGFTFGFKLLLIAVALVFANWFQQRVMLAITSLVAVTFLCRFSIEVLTNHKFLNIWLIVANLFVAAALWRMWNSSLLRSVVPARIAAAVLVVLITLSGVIDLFPIRNSFWYNLALNDDPLIDWVQENTDPKAIFLTDRVVNNQILLAGRRLFYGWPYFAWGAGYQTTARDAVYKRLFEERNPQTLLRLLRENNISYVVIDNGVRKSDFIKNPNEVIYQNHFERVFEDSQNRYNGLNIYKISTDIEIAATPAAPEPAVDVAAAVNAFEGGSGDGGGQFKSPRGIAADAAGNLYVADTGNARIQKFSSDGTLIRTFGKAGQNIGELREPNGVAVDAAGNIYVADALNHRLNKYKSDGAFESQSSGPPSGFYGPRDVAVAAGGYFYVLDQGGARVVKLSSQNEVIAEWGRKGTGEGEFDDPTGLAVDTGRVYVADARNARIQIFDHNGTFINQFPVEEWEQNLGQYPDVAVDPQTGRIYATSGGTNEVLVFDDAGKRFDSLKPEDSKLDNPSSLFFADLKTSKNLYILNTNGARVSSIVISKAAR